MARYDNPQQLAVEVSGKKLFLQKVAFTATPGVTTLATTSTAASGSVPVPAGAKLMLQADQAFYYQLLPAGAVSSVTTIAGAQPGALVALGAQEHVFMFSTDTQLDIVRSTADGTVAIFMEL